MNEFNFYKIDHSTETLKEQTYYTLHFYNKLMKTIDFSVEEALSEQDLEEKMICPHCKEANFHHHEDCNILETPNFQKESVKFLRTLSVPENFGQEYRDFREKAEALIDETDDDMDELTLDHLLTLDYDKLLELDVIYNYEVGKILNSNGYSNLTVCPCCRFDDFTHVEGCEKQSIIDSI